MAVYCAKHLPKIIKNSPAFKSGDIERALEESFMKFDASLKEEKVIQQLKEIAGLNNCSDEGAVHFLCTVYNSFSLHA